MYRSLRFASSTRVSTYRRLKHPTSVPLSKIFSNNFPLLVSESIKDFRIYHNNKDKFQHDLLSLLPFYPKKDDLGRYGEIIKTVIDNEGNYINEFVIHPAQKPKNHLIMIHGYGAGLGFYIKNFEALAIEDWEVHSIDLLGYGYSSRPPFNASSVEEVESWFHDSFEKWLKIRGLDTKLDNILIMAHSMGAYLMATYGLLKNPTFCRKMIMCSPGAVIKHKNPMPIPDYFKRLWERNISPFTLVRKAGPLGLKVVSGWSSRRFSELSNKEMELLHRYSYGIFNSPGSGEYMLNFLLAPGADARLPLVDRNIHLLQPQVEWWYGKEDWMDVDGGKLCSELINKEHNKLWSTVKEIPHSGHHVYLDNMETFNDMMVKEMRSWVSN